MGDIGAIRRAGGSARHRHHAHAEPRAPGECRHHLQPRRRALGCARHIDRHRQPHAHDQRHRRAGLGVGGLEAESVMFGMPVMLRVPDVIGVRFTGRLRDGVLATDLALTVTERLRRIDLADHFVEFFGPGVSTLSAGDRAVVANMTPEFGANSGFFPIDQRTLDYLAQTGRSSQQVALVEAYARRQGLWFDPDASPRYTDTLIIDLDE